MQSTESEQPLGNDIMDRLWLRMTEIYGHKWTSAYGDKPLTIWANALGRFDNNQLKTGLEKMLENNIEWPPTLTEFMALCKPERIEPCHKTARLPKLPERKTISVGEKYLKTIRGKL